MSISGLWGRVLGVLVAAMLAFEVTQLLWLSLVGADLGTEGFSLRALVLATIPALFAAALALAIGLRAISRDLLSLLGRLRRIAREPGPSTDERDEILRMTRALDRQTADLRTASAALMGERGRLEAVLGGMRDGVLALGSDGRVTLANPAAAELLGVRRDPLGSTLFELTRAKRLSELAADALEGSAGTTEVEIRSPTAGGGQLRVARVLATATPQEGGGCVFVLRDVTELRRLETARRDFIANVSHEIRTPVATIRASAEALAHGGLEDPAESGNFVAAILRHAERLGALIEDMLSLSRIEAGRVDLHLEPLEMAIEVGASCLAVEQRLSSRRQTLEQDVPEDLVVYADTRALEHVLLNLLDNAIKYTPEGGHIQVSARPVAEGVRVEVRDNGPGIAPQHRERLFERFYRVDSGRSRELGGTGLGLAIVKHLVEVMGGKVGMIPGNGGGSVFWCTLPSGPGQASRPDAGIGSSLR